MSRFVIICAAIVACLTSLSASAEPNVSQATKSIPLKDIWAYQMPGTRDVRELEPDKFGPRIRKLSSAEQLEVTGKSFLSQLGSRLQSFKPGQPAPQAFAVAGTGADALREAAAVLSGTRKSQLSFPENTNVSVVFFSREFNYYVHLDKVEQLPGQLSISYRFVPHETKDMTQHVALIPIGQLPPGTVKVDIKRLPMGTKFSEAGFKEPPGAVDSQIIAQSFRFTVNGKSE
jgi:hypothetical protein